MITICNNNNSHKGSWPFFTGRLFPLILLIATLVCFSPNHSFAQLRGINYQAVAIDETGQPIAGVDINGQPISNESIAIRFSILDASATGPIPHSIRCLKD